MDASNTTVISAHATLSLSSYHRWNTLSPSSLMSENDDDNNEMKACGTMKIEHPFESDDPIFLSNSAGTASAQQLQRRQLGSTATVIPTIPLASCATAAASLSSAFNKKLVSSTRNQHQLLQQQHHNAVMAMDEVQLTSASSSSKQTLEVLLANERQFHRGLANNSISIPLIKAEQNSQSGENSNCHSTTTPQPSSKALTGAATTELLGDRRDDEALAPVNSVTSNDTAQMDIYRDLILRHLIQDINTTCSKLGLPTDPQAWSAEHSARWMSEMCVQFQLPPPRQLYMNGRTLLSMTQDDFMVRAPEGGDTLHAQLQLWKTAYDSYSQQDNNNNNNNNINNNNNNNNSNNSGSNQDTVHVTQNCSRSSQYWVNSSPLALNVTEQGELLTSAQDYLNNFNPSNSEATIAMNCYSNNTYQNMSPEGALLANATVQQQYYASAQAAGIGMLPSPSDSEMSSNGSSMNDVNIIDGSVLDARQTGTPQLPRHSGTVHLWHFIRELLDHPKQYSSCVRWVDRQEGTFKIESSHHLARFWGQRKNRAQMNYDKLSRSLRQYYKKGIIQKPEKKQRLVYKFLPPYNL